MDKSLSEEVVKALEDVKVYFLSITSCPPIGPFSSLHETVIFSDKPLGLIQGMGHATVMSFTMCNRHPLLNPLMPAIALCGPYVRHQCMIAKQTFYCN